jgi:hypothetical protein
MPKSTRRTPGLFVTIARTRSFYAVIARWPAVAFDTVTSVVVAAVFAVSEGVVRTDD